MRFCCRSCLFLIGLTFVSSSSIRNKSHNEENFKEKKNQSKIITDEEFKKLKIDLFKERLLMKLNMDSPPKFSRPMQRSFRQIFESKPRYGENSDVDIETTIIFPDNVSNKTNSIFPSVSLTFRINPETFPKDFLSAELWFYKKYSSDKKYYKFTVAEVYNEYSLQKSILNSSEISNESKWTLVNISGSVKKWHEQRNTLHTFELSCSKCDPRFPIPVKVTGNLKPYIKVILAEKPKDILIERNKRSTNCNASNNSGCCKQALFINFTDIGWDNWIVQPSGYMANYCKGNCLNDVDMFDYPYSTVLREFIRKNEDAADELKVALCCSPSKMAPISIIYKEQDNLVLVRQLENLIVEECSCF